MHYHLFHLIFYLILTLFFRYKVVGRENVPRKGPALLACNHVSYLDPAIATTGLWRKVRFAARESLFNNRWANWWLRGVQAFPISRDIMTKRALRTILDLLRRGELVLLFPEGTRSPDGSLQGARPGVAMIAHMAKAPVIPIYVAGTYEALPRGAKFWHLRIVPMSVYYGPPVPLEKYYAMPKYKEIYEDMGREIMEAIHRLKEQHEQTKGRV